MLFSVITFYCAEAKKKYKQRRTPFNGKKQMRKKRISRLPVMLLSMMLICTILCSMGYIPVPVYQAAQQTFTVGFDAEFPPYGYKDDNGEYVGFDLDLAAEVCARRGWTLKKQPIDWDSKDMELSSGAIDCIWNGFTIDGREDQYTWSVPYVDNSQVVVVKSDSSIQKPADLKDQIVIVQKDSSALAAFTGEDATDENKALAKSFKELQQVGDYNTAFLNLESGMAQAVCMDIGVAGFQIKQRGDKFRMLEDRISSEKYGVGFKLGNTELRDKVQESLFEMKADGKFDEIAKKWNLETSICLTDGSDSAAATPDQTEEPDQTAPAQSESKKDIDYLSMFMQLLQGMGATLLIFVLTLLFSMPLGLLLTFVRMSKFRILQIIARVYISIMRGTPLMLQLLVVCFGPYYIFGIPLDDSYRFYAVIIGFSLNYAAYFAEIFRAGIQAVPNGQKEAASILGYSKAQTFGRIIFPQMAKNVLPPVTNEIITLVKDTSLAFVLTYTEIFTLAKQIAAAQANIIPLFAAGIFYYVFNAIVAFVMSRIVNKMNYYK